MSVADRLRRFAEAVRLDGTRFRVGDEPWHDRAALPVPQDDAGLRAVLVGHLYNIGHAGGWPDTVRAFVGPRTPPPDPDHVAALGPSIARFDPGWRRVSVGADGRVLFAKGAWRRWSDRWVTPRPGDGTPWLPGNLALPIPASHPGPSGTFQFRYGATLGDDPLQGHLLRVYLHTRPPDAAAVVLAVEAALDGLQVPFVLKTLLAPSAVDRTDATVLYVRRRYARCVLRAIRRLGVLLDALGPQTPLCALRLHPGVAVAEDTDTPESFGMHRMGLVADAVRDTRAGGDRWAAVVARFTAAGIAVDAPHRSPGSASDHAADWAPTGGAG